MYHLNTFYFHKNEGGSEFVGGRCIKKAIKKCHEINKFSILTSPKTSLQNAIHLEVFLLSLLTM